MEYHCSIVPFHLLAASITQFRCFLPNNRLNTCCLYKIDNSVLLKLEIQEILSLECKSRTEFSGRCPTQT